MAFHTAVRGSGDVNISRRGFLKALLAAPVVIVAAKLGGIALPPEPVIAEPVLLTGEIGVIENFRAASFTKSGRTRTSRNWLSVDRGYRNEIIALVQAIQCRGNAPVSFEDYLSTTRTSFAIEVSLRTRGPVELPYSFATASSTGA